MGAGQDEPQGHAVVVGDDVQGRDRGIGDSGDEGTEEGCDAVPGRREGAGEAVEPAVGGVQGGHIALHVTRVQLVDGSGDGAGVVDGHEDPLGGWTVASIVASPRERG